MIPHLKRNKIVVIGFAFSFPYEYTKNDGTQNASGNILFSFKYLLTCLEACGIVKTLSYLDDPVISTRQMIPGRPSAGVDSITARTSRLSLRPPMLVTPSSSSPPSSSTKIRSNTSQTTSPHVTSPKFPLSSTIDSTSSYQVPDSASRPQTRSHLFSSSVARPIITPHILSAATMDSTAIPSASNIAETTSSSKPPDESFPEDLTSKLFLLFQK